MIPGLRFISSGVAAVPWSTKFDEPIELPDERKLRTLRDAAEYVLALPPKVAGRAPLAVRGRMPEERRRARDRVDVVRAAIDDARAARAPRSADRQR